MPRTNNKRTIQVLFFADSDQMYTIERSTRWYKYPRKAHTNAVDAMIHNLYGAKVAVVYDDEIGKDLYVIVRHIDGRVETIPNAEAFLEENLHTSSDPDGSHTLKLIATAGERKHIEK